MAARGTQVLITAHPKGRFEDVIISGTPKPGTVMEIQTPFFRGGRHKWRVYQPGTNGQQRVIAVLLEDANQGFGLGTAYVDGKMGTIYFPLPGEELNMLLADVAGTADDHLAGETLMVKTGTGTLIATTGSPESNPFRLLEAATDPTADFYAPCQFTGY